jgi:hypothetical protein
VAVENPVAIVIGKGTNQNHCGMLKKPDKGGKNTTNEFAPKAGLSAKTFWTIISRM